MAEDKGMHARKARNEARTPSPWAALMRAAHDMKGQAATFDYPMIARVAGSLSKLIGELPENRDLPLGLVDAHVSAIHVIYRDKVMDASNKMAVALSAELEKQVAALLTS